jgi:aspartate/methionine/tyrosine aminotransferase
MHCLDQRFSINRKGGEFIMKLKVSKLESIIQHIEKDVDYHLGASSCESFKIEELLEFADDECRKLWENLETGYNDFRGNARLREAIAERYKAISANNILEATTEAGTFIVLNTMLEPGDEAIIMQPAMQQLSEITNAIGSTVIPWMLEPAEWGWRLDIDFLENAITQRTKLIIINVPNNPTGYSPVLPDLQRIANIAGNKGIWIYSEESYRGMEHDPGGGLPSMADLYDRAISLSGLGKHGLSGLGIAWLVSQNSRVIEDCLAFKNYISPSPNALTEILALVAIRSFKDLALRNRRIILENVGLAEAYFYSKPDWFSWTMPNGGSTAFPRLNIDYPVEAFCKEVMNEVGIMLIPDSAFYVDMNRFRVGFGRKNFGMALAKFAGFMESFMSSR